MKRCFLVPAVVCGMVLAATLSASAAGNRSQRSSGTHTHKRSASPVIIDGQVVSTGGVVTTDQVISGPTVTSETVVPGPVASGVAGAYGGAPMWNGGYYDPAWGMPLALVVPPRSQTEVGYAWGVGNTFIRPITAQFQPYYPGPYYYDGRAYRPTPCWPSHTDQFGVYNVRGPW